MKNAKVKNAKIDAILEKFRNCHGDVMEIARAARALYDQLGLSPEFVARVLYQDDGLGIPLDDVARVLYIEAGFDLDEYAIASVLHSPLGLGLPAESVARVLYHTLGLGASWTAKVLGHDGLGLTPGEVARVLRSESGLGLSDEEVAGVLGGYAYRLTCGEVLEALQYAESRGAAA